LCLSAIVLASARIAASSLLSPLAGISMTFT
jgi:hypothetical protein